MASNLYSVRPRKTNDTNRGVDILARMPNLRVCHVDGPAVSADATQRLDNTMVLRTATFPAVMRFLLRYMLIEAEKTGAGNSRFFVGMDLQDTTIDCLSSLTLTLAIVLPGC